MFHSKTNFFNMNSGPTFGAGHDLMLDCETEENDGLLSSTYFPYALVSLKLNPTVWFKQTLNLQRNNFNLMNVC